MVDLVPAGTTGKGAAPIIDAHTHIFPSDVIARRSTYLPRDLWFAHLYEPPAAKLVGADDLLGSMTAAGIDAAIVAGFPWADAGLCWEHNDMMAEACAGSGGRLHWLGIVSPNSGREAAREAARCFALGAVGLGEFNADAQRWEPTDARVFAPIAEVCAAADRPIMLHASEPLGHAYPGKGTATPDRLLAFLTAYPTLRVALAHWGGGLPFYELMPEVAALTGERVVYDSAASTYLYRFDVFPIVTRLAGAERVLFASDYPVLRQDRFLRRTLGADLPPDAVAAILGKNARRFYRLPETASVVTAPGSEAAR